MDQNLKPGDLVQSSSDGDWNVESIEYDVVKCFRYDDDWEKHEKEFALSDLQLVEKGNEEIFTKSDLVKLTSGGPSWTVLDTKGNTAVCAMPEEFDFMEVEFPLVALKMVE